MAGGRPTKYTDELLAEARAYISDFQEHGDLIPSLAGLACVVGLSRETINVWSNEKPEFSDIVKDLLAKQERVLLNGGLSGAMNASITKLVLSKHNYSDKQEVQQDITSKGEQIKSIAPHQFVGGDQ
jgi:hypothetical protein